MINLNIRMLKSKNTLFFVFPRLLQIQKKCFEIAGTSSMLPVCNRG